MQQAWTPFNETPGLPLPLSNDVERIYSAAYEFARSNHHDFIDTNHLWLGIHVSPPNPASLILSVCNISYDTILNLSDFQIGRDSFNEVLCLTPSLLEVFREAARESRSLGHTTIEAVDLLTALGMRNDVMSKVMFSRMADYKNLRVDLMRR